MKKYKSLEIIGDGTYGTVWRGTLIETGELVAIKKLKNKIKSWQECMELKEVKVLSKLKSHPNIIKLKEIIRETNSEVFMIFEYAELNLFQYVEKIRRRGETIPERKIKEIIYQLTNGMQFIHHNGYFHRDIKPENILILNEHSNSCEDFIKIADFGLAREMPAYYNSVALTDYVCTRWYRAPECILKSINYSSPMDVWAIGCVMAELYMSSPIFPGTSEIDQLTKVTNILGSPKFNDWPEGFKLIQKIGMKFPISNGVSLSSIMPNASTDAINLMTEIFQWDALSRPNCAKILSNPFFDEIKSIPRSKYSANTINYSNSSNTASSYLSTNMNNIYDNTIKNHNSSNSIINNNYQNTQTTQNPKVSNNNFSNYYLNTDNYLNNFNFKNYRNSNNYIPDINSYNATINNILLYNNIGTNNNHKSKLSSMAENDFNTNFNKYNNKLNVNNNHYAINNIYDQILQTYGNSNYNEYLEDHNPNNSNNYNFSKNVPNFTNFDYLPNKSYNTRDKENYINLNSYQTAFYPY
jgi:serine/threonine protein kinase